MIRLEAIENCLPSPQIALLKRIAEKASLGIEETSAVLAALDGFDRHAVADLVGACVEVERILEENP